MTEPFADRVERGDVLLGAVVRLPADEAVALIAGAGLGFVVIDLVDGPLDEVRFQRVVRAARGVGLGVVALADDERDAGRLRTLGADLVTGSGGLAVVADRAAARRALSGGARLVALDVAVAMAGALSSFATSPSAKVTIEPVVLLPGMLCDARLFDGVVAALPADVASRPVRIDLDDSIAELAASVLAVAPERFALAGHSLGGIVALEVWRRAPARVGRIALLNTSARPPSEGQLAAWATLRDRTEAGRFPAVAAELASSNVGSSGGSEVVQRSVQMAEKVGPDGFLRQLRAQASRPDSRPSLVTITVPTLVLSGADDAVCPPELQVELASGIPGAEHVIVDGAGHMSPLDHPAEVAAHLATWLTA